MDTFYSVEELEELGIKKYGANVKISRNAILYRPDLLEIGNNVRIDDFAILGGKIVLGNNIHICQFCGIYGADKGVFMEDFSALSSRVVVYATSNDFSGKSMTNPTVPEEYHKYDKNESVIIGKHAIIGTGSTVMPGANIAEGVAIGAMSLVIHPTDPWGIYVGIPVKRIQDREKDILEFERDYLRKYVGGTDSFLHVAYILRRAA